MSKVFDVFPSRADLPSYRELLAIASGHLNGFLWDYGIERPVRLSVGLRSNDEASRVLPIDLDGPCWWPATQYAWFSVPGVDGGTDAYANEMRAHDPDDLGRGILTDEISGGKAVEFADPIRRSLLVGRYWGFRRSAGQPAVINVAYGMIAASLAELTDGIVHSIDGAWDHRLLPARPADFLSWYFRPERTDVPEWKGWAEQCIRQLADEVERATEHA
jgi:hypothetical protein